MLAPDAKHMHVDATGLQDIWPYGPSAELRTSITPICILYVQSVQHRQLFGQEVAYDTRVASLHIRRW